MVKIYDNSCINPNYYLFGVFKNQKLIASATLSKCLDLTGNALFYFSMENFIVDKEYRRQGVGTALMSYLEDFVKNQNGRYISFTSSSYRIEGHQFYEKLGYSLN